LFYETGGTAGVMFQPDTGDLYLGGELERFRNLFPKDRKTFRQKWEWLNANMMRHLSEI